ADDNTLTHEHSALHSQLKSGNLKSEILNLKFHRSSLAGCTSAPFPAESHAAKRTHFWFARSNGISKRCRPNGESSVAGTTRRPVVRPSPQTTSTNSSGKVHSTSATIARFSPVPWTLNEGINTSPEVAK